MVPSLLLRDEVVEAEEAVGLGEEGSIRPAALSVARLASAEAAAEGLQTGEFGEIEILLPKSLSATRSPAAEAVAETMGTSVAVGEVFVSAAGGRGGVMSGAPYPMFGPKQYHLTIQPRRSTSKSQRGTAWRV